MTKDDLWTHLIPKTYFVPWGRGWVWGWLQWRWLRPQSALDRIHGSRIRWLEDKDFLEFGGRFTTYHIMWDAFTFLVIPIVLSSTQWLSMWFTPVMFKLPFSSRSWICSLWGSTHYESISWWWKWWWRWSSWWRWNYSWMSNMSPMPRVTKVVASHWKKECILLQLLFKFLPEFLHGRRPRCIQ